MLPLMFAHAIDRHDVGMMETRNCFGFGLETLYELAAGKLPKKQNFNRHNPVERTLPRAIYNAHAAAGQFFEQLIIAKYLSRGRDSAGYRRRAPRDSRRGLSGIQTEAKTDQTTWAKIVGRARTYTGAAAGTGSQAGHLLGLRIGFFVIHTRLARKVTFPGTSIA